MENEERRAELRRIHDDLRSFKDPWANKKKEEPVLETVDKIVNKPVDQSMDKLAEQPSLLDGYEAGKSSIDSLLNAGLQKRDEYTRASNAYKKYFYNREETLEEARQISKKTGIPFNAIIADPKNMDNARGVYEKLNKGINIDQLYEEFPELKNLASRDEASAAIAIHNLDDVKKSHSILEAAKIGYNRDNLRSQRSKIGLKGFYGAELTQEDRDKLKAIEGQMQELEVMPSLLEAPIASVVGGMAEQGPMMIRQLLGSWDLAGLGALAGVAMEMVKNRETLSKVPLAIAIQGARAGFGSGVKLGFSREMFNEVVGDYYLQYTGYKDNKGQQLYSDNEARTFAALNAAVETGIEMSNFDTIVGILRKTPGDAANILKDIIQGAKDNASVKAQIKTYLKTHGKDFLKVAVGESAEEAVQEVASMGIENMAHKYKPYGNVPTHDLKDVAVGSAQAFYQALPASIGFGAIGVGAGSIQLVNRVADVIHKNQQQSKLLNGLNMLQEMLKNKTLNKLAKEHPDTYKDVVQEQLKDTAYENVYLDTELMLENEDNAEVLNQIASAAGISEEELSAAVRTGAPLSIKTADYLNMLENEQINEKLHEYIAFDAADACFAKNKRYAEIIKKTMDAGAAELVQKKMLGLESMLQEAFQDEEQKMIAEQIILEHDNPVEGIKIYKEQTKAEIESILEPVISRMRSGMKQGVDLVDVDKYGNVITSADADVHTGGRRRISNNDVWYSRYYKEHGSAPSEKQLRELAYDILTGNNEYGVVGYEFNSAEMEDWAQENKSKLDYLYGMLTSLDEIEPIMGTLDTGVISSVDTLSPEAVKVYTDLFNKLKVVSPPEAKKAASMNAYLLALHADSYAAIMRLAGNKNYTAQDYYKKFKVQSGGMVGGLFQQENEELEPWPVENYTTISVNDNDISLTVDHWPLDKEEIKELGKKAVKYYKENLQGDEVVNEQLVKKYFPDNKNFAIHFSRKAYQKMKGLMGTPEKSFIIASLKDIIKNANYVSFSKSNKTKYKEDFYYLHAKVRIKNDRLGFDTIRYVISTVILDDRENLTLYNVSVYNPLEYGTLEKKKKTEQLNNVPGVSNPEGNLAIRSSLRNIVQDINGEIKLNQTAWHGGRSGIEQFDIGKIGTGTGAFMHGWGLYFAKNKKAAKGYKDALGNDAQLYEVDVPENRYMLDEDKRFGYQLKTVQKNVLKAINALTEEQKKIFAEKLMYTYQSKTHKKYIDEDVKLGDLISLQKSFTNISLKKGPMIGTKKIRAKSYLRKAGFTDEQIQEFADNPEKAMAEAQKYDEQIQQQTVIRDKAKAEDDAFYEAHIQSVIENMEKTLKDEPGKQIYNALAYALNNGSYDFRMASEYLNKYDIKGITYDNGPDGRCFVVFDDKAIEIIERYNQSAGTNANFADIEKLFEAEDMLEDGASMQEIYKATGWHLEKDGQWRFEIPDDLNKIDVKQLAQPNQILDLEDVYDNEALYRAYPFLRLIEIHTIDRNEQEYKGYTQNGDIYLVVDENSLRVDGISLKCTLVHELQHIIQDRENFATGGSIEYIILQLETQINNYEKEIEENYGTRGLMYYLNLKDSLQIKDEEAIKKLEADKKSIAEFLDEYDIAAIEEITAKVTYLEERLEQAQTSMADQIQVYKDLHGEQEARSTSERASFWTRINELRNKDSQLVLQEREDYIASLDEEQQQIARNYVEDPSDANFKELMKLGGMGRFKMLSFKVRLEEDIQSEIADLEDRLEKEIVEGINQKDAVVTFGQVRVAGYQASNIKGQSTWNKGNRIIALFSSADQSTFAHEMAHICYRDLEDLATMENAPRQVIKDLETLNKWAEWKPEQIKEYQGTATYEEFLQRDREICAAQLEGFAVREGKKIPLKRLLYEWKQERFARGFEQYLKNGKAPTPGLSGLFAKFKNWLTKVYKHFKAIGGAPSKEVEAIMTRMLLTNEAIDRALEQKKLDAFEKAGGLKYLSGTAQDMWMDAYSKISAEVYEKVYKIAIRDSGDEAKARRMDQLAKERNNYQDKLSKESVFMVEQALKINPTLGLENACQALGLTVDEYQQQMKAYGGSLEKAVDQYMKEYENELQKITKEEMEKMAEEAIFSSKYQKLISAYELQGLERYRRSEQLLSKKIAGIQAKDEEDRKEQERVIREMDKKAREKEEREAKIAELRAAKYAEGKGQRQMRDVAKGRVSQIENLADVNLADLTVAEAANPKLWSRKSRESGAEVAEAIAKGDWDRATKAKEKQLVYDVMTDRAMQNRRFLDKQGQKLRQRARTIKREKNMQANDRYLFFHLLFMFGYTKTDALKPASFPEQLSDQLASYNQSLEMPFIDQNGNFTVSDFILNAAMDEAARIKGVSDLSMTQLRELMSFMDNIYTIAVDANKIKKINGGNITVEEAVEEIIKNRGLRLTKPSEDKTGMENISAKEKLLEEADKFHVSLLKPETIIDYLGQKAMEFIYNPIKAAADNELVMTEELGKEIEGIMGSYESGRAQHYMEDGMSEKEALKKAEQDMEEMYTKHCTTLGTSKLTKENLLAIALNWGTDNNRKRILNFNDVTPVEIVRALGELDAADWQFVTNVWELFDSYFPRLQEVEANLSGVMIEQQQAVPFQIMGRDGALYTLKGGYYPIKYDRHKNYAVGRITQDEGIRSQMSSNVRLGMGLGATKERQQRVVYKPRLDLAVLTEALTDTIHIISMRETVRDVSRIIHDKQFQDVITEEYGTSVMELLENWVLDCWQPEIRDKYILDTLSRSLRQKQTMAVLGFKTATALLNICNVGPMAAYLGVGRSLQALKKFYGRPREYYNFIMNKSAFIRNRAETMDRDMGDMMKRQGFLAKADKFTALSFWFITKTDLMLACPMWLSEYQRSFQENFQSGKSAAEIDRIAVEAGDQAVRRVFGSGQMKDLAPVQKGSEFWKIFTMFYSYSSVVYNAISAKHMQHKYNPHKWIKMLPTLILWLVVPAFLEAVIKNSIKGDSDWEDILKDTMANTVNTASGGVPVLREVTPLVMNAVLEGRNYGTSKIPVYDFVDQILKTGFTAKSVVEGRKEPIDLVYDLIKTGTYASGLPLTFFDAGATTWQFISNMIDEGELTAEAVKEYIWAVLFDKKIK